MGSIISLVFFYFTLSLYLHSSWIENKELAWLPCCLLSSSELFRGSTNRSATLAPDGSLSLIDNSLGKVDHSSFSRHGSWECSKMSGSCFLIREQSAKNNNSEWLLELCRFFMTRTTIPNVEKIKVLCFIYMKSLQNPLF